VPVQTTQTGCRQKVAAQDAPEILLLPATQGALEALQVAASVTTRALVPKFLQEQEPEQEPAPHWRE
jgi:hypothetical protein